MLPVFSYVSSNSTHIDNLTSLDHNPAQSPFIVLHVITTEIVFQWFIDHADLIVLVYDYAKLDIGPETEALLDQLKGREQQVKLLI